MVGLVPLTHLHFHWVKIADDLVGHKSSGLTPDVHQPYPCDIMVVAQDHSCKVYSRLNIANFRQPGHGVGFPSLALKVTEDVALRPRRERYLFRNRNSSAPGGTVFLNEGKPSSPDLHSSSPKTDPAAVLSQPVHAEHGLVYLVRHQEFGLQLEPSVHFHG